MNEELINNKKHTYTALKLRKPSKRIDFIFRFYGKCRQKFESKSSLFLRKLGSTSMVLSCLYVNGSYQMQTETKQFTSVVSEIEKHNVDFFVVFFSYSIDKRKENIHTNNIGKKKNRNSKPSKINT